MKLTAFRVQNYKKIRDTGWITVRNLTAFVGKNESGKSALFRGLSKLNPSDGEKYDGLKEFPRRRYTEEFKKQDWPGASGKFELSDDDKEALVDICSELEDCTHVVCTRYYPWRLEVNFEPAPSVAELKRSEFAKVLEHLEQKILELSAPEGKGNALGAIKNALQSKIAELKNQASRPPNEVVPHTETEQLRNAIAAQSNEDWQQKVLEPIRQQAEELFNRAELSQQLEEAKKWVENNLPQFIYFDRYDVIDSAVHLPTFAQQLNNTPTAPKVRTTRCLFEHVGLDINHIEKLGRRQQPQQGPSEEIRRYVDERAIHLSSASSAMTAKFQDWWEQRRHKFRYQADGDYFRIWVSDDLDPSEIELDQRSLGMQYFFSFYTVFLVEAEGTHQNSILLLDEPGLHMHGTAQANIVKFLEKLSHDNQTMYTTHSPFMVDADRLERVRIVYESEDGTTRVSEDVWPRDRDALFPLQAGLGYQLVQSLFIAKHQLIVEGLTDYWILKAFAEGLSQRELPTLRNDVVIVPSAGLTKLLPLASMLIGHDVEVVALLDGDEPGRKEGKKLVDKLLVGDTNQCLFIGDFVYDKPHSELEDIFPEELYLQAVKQAYKIRSIKFNKEEQAIEGIVDKLKAWFERTRSEKFEKWRVAAQLRDWILEDPKQIPDDTFQVVSRIFEAINKAFTHSIASTQLQEHSHEG